MNKAITDGLTLMPPPFMAGLGVWSSGDGTPGSPTYDGVSNAAFVPADADFGGCLDIQKTQSVQRLRYMGQTPIVPGMYLRIRARVKAISGNLPNVRIAAWAGNAAGQNVPGVVQISNSVTLTSYGRIFTIEAIVGSGNRPGVDMVWGTVPIYGHFGIDLTGPNGGIVRIDDIEIEDATSVFHRSMMDWVDVRDYGAIGDGVANDTTAFELADAAAAGRVVLVPAGTFRIAGNLTMASPVRFEGTITQPSNRTLALTQNFDLASYAKAFGSEAEGLLRAIRALFYFTDHVELDLNGRTVDVLAPIDVAAVAGRTGEGFNRRRVIRNGQLNVVSGPAWQTRVVTSRATYDTATPNRLVGVENVANIEVGSLVTGNGVARETYVQSVNVAAGTVELSLPPGYTEGTRTYTFTRHRYVLDFSGFGQLEKFELAELEFLCQGEASGIILAPEGITFRLRNSVMNFPKDRGISSIGRGCQGIMVDECQFLSNEQSLRAQDRTSICMNINANDAKIRDNRVVRFAHFAIVHGTGHMFLGNHFFQGDSESPGVRRAGLVFTGVNVSSVVTGNYIDNAYVEMTNERAPNPDFGTELPFGGLTITGNVFFAIGAAPSFAWIVITPHGNGHFLQGLSVTGNTFRSINTTLNRVERVDTTHANLDFSRLRNVLFEANTFTAVTNPAFSPLVVRHSQNSEAETWTIDPDGKLPFQGRIRTVTSVVAEGPIRNGTSTRHDFPHVLTEQGSDSRKATVHWPVAVRGTVEVSVRVDNP
jgi:hypothetical protein